MRTIRATGVRTIFPERSANAKLARAVARDAGATIGPALYADTLGAAGSPGATYIGSLRFNTRALAAGFGAAASPALSAVGVPGLQERQRIDGARRRCTSPGALHSSKCRWQPRASPVSPTLPIGWPVSTRAPFASGDGSRRCM